jgi:hypothetical protein
MSVTVFPAPSTGGTSKTQITAIFKATGSWLCPAGVTQVEVILCGGGGGATGLNGASGNRNGGSGSVFYEFLTVVPATTYTITIGAGGAGSLNFFAANGGTSSFGGLMTATGGNFASASLEQVQGAGLGGGGGWVNRNNSGSPVTFSGQPGAFGFGGGGGAAQGEWGAMNSAGSNGGGRGTTASAGGNGLANTGSGGGGVGNTGAVTFTGGSGGSGICIIKYWA